MATSLKTLDLYSQEAQKIVKWNIASKEEEDEGGNKHQVVVLTYKEEIHRFSPNITDGELERFASTINEENN